MTTELSALESVDNSFEITDTGLRIDRNLTFDEWMQVGARLWAGHQAYKWAIADWLAYGEHKYGEKYAQLESSFDYSKQTLMNYASTARSIPPSERRATVSFSNHSEVASLDPLSRTQALDKLETKAWNRDDLRQWKRALKGGDTDTEQTVTLRFTHMQRSDDKLIVVFIPPDGEIVDFKAIVRKPKAQPMEQSA